MSPTHLTPPSNDHDIGEHYNVISPLLIFLLFLLFFCFFFPFRLLMWFILLFPPPLPPLFSIHFTRLVKLRRCSTTVKSLHPNNLQNWNAVMCHPPSVYTTTTTHNKNKMKSTNYCFFITELTDSTNI